MEKKIPSPSLAELAGWQANPVTQWIMAQANRKFLQPTGLLPIKHQESVLMVNYYAGAKDAFNAIDLIAKNGV